MLGCAGKPRPEVIAGAGVGEDCAVLDFGEYECVVSVDPVTAEASFVGKLAVMISCNDIASNGVEPLAVLLTVLLPPSVTEEEIGEIARQADEAAKELGVQIVGGHTEITDAVTRPLISATAIGRAPARASGLSLEGGHSPHAEPGDLIVVTKKLALEGTAIAAIKREEDLRSYLTDAEIEHAKSMLGQISVVKEGVIAGRFGVKTMHDVTEGGVLGAVWEVCIREGIGAEITSTALPFDPVTMAVCAVLDLDPMRLISSGAMLIYISEEKWRDLSPALSEAGVAATVIGRAKPPEDGIRLVMRDGAREDITPPGPDEVYKI